MRARSISPTAAVSFCDVSAAAAKRGKQPKLNRRQEAHLVALHKDGEYSTAELADLFGGCPLYRLPGG